MTRGIDIARLMRPRSVAIVGVSPQPGSPGGGVLDNLERYGYGGDIHLVSRSRGEVKGRPCVASIDDLPEGVDTVLLTIPRAAIEEAVSACARRAGGAVIIFAAGFAEAVNGRRRRSVLRLWRATLAWPCAAPIVSAS
jgi:acyl-CoA synthetase (NDP forming)